MLLKYILSLKGDLLLIFVFLWCFGERVLRVYIVFGFLVVLIFVRKFFKILVYFCLRYIFIYIFFY